MYARENGPPNKRQGSEYARSYMYLMLSTTPLDLC